MIGTLSPQWKIGGRDSLIKLSHSSGKQKSRQEVIPGYSPELGTSRNWRGREGRGGRGGRESFLSCGLDHVSASEPIILFLKHFHRSQKRGGKDTSEWKIQQCWHLEMVFGGEVSNLDFASGCPRVPWIIFSDVGVCRWVRAHMHEHAQVHFSGSVDFVRS